jgi:hypothetical protein
MPVNDGPNVGIVTLFAHQSGQWIEGTVFAQPTKFDAQGVGSVITYLRRYSLAAMAGVAPDDDDGEAAVGRPAPQAKEWGANGLRTVPRRQDAAAVGPDQRDAKQQVRELMDAIDATDDAELLLRFAEWPQLLELDEVLKRAVTPAAQAETIAMLVSRAAKRREGLIGSLKPFGFDQ